MSCQRTVQCISQLHADVSINIERLLITRAIAMRKILCHTLH